ncbi:MAG: zinc ribbon domain-containing protein [Gammaproteobacteria bacterium]|nr:zinc ribbon domain-containing protein [Gammaproteobacteria bacterium]
MPIYEYQCQQCGHKVDALQRISEPPLTECPDCGQSALRKLVSAPSFRLKGGGWYETDFKTGSKKNLAGEQEGKKAGGKEGEKTPDTKAAKTPKSPDSAKGDKGSGDGGKAA